MKTLKSGAKTKAKPPLDEARVELSARGEFPVRFTRGSLSPGNPDLLEVLRRRDPLGRHRVFFALDAGLAAVEPELPDMAKAYVAAHKGSMTLVASPLVVEGGESAKSRPEVCDWLRARFAAAALDARSHLIVIGGGALLDAAGFAAATLSRSPRVTRLPTTLLAQAGGALALRCFLNGIGRKDALAAPQIPHGVLIDPQWLAYLPDRHKRAGLASAARTALAGDAELFHWIADHSRALAALERRALETLARWCARLRWEADCDRDPWGFAEAAPLEFAGWSSRRLESAAAGALLHGEAEAIGTAVDLLLSVLLSGMPPRVARAALEVLSALGLPLWHEALGEADSDGAPALISGLAECRGEDGIPVVTLLRAWGQPVRCASVNAEATAAAIEALRRWNGDAG